jgi:hypothetical protein
MSIALDGVTDLPPGTVAAIVTYLEMRVEPCQPTTSTHSYWALIPIKHDLARYLDLYATVGERWLWFSRAVLPDDRLRAILEHPAVEVFALRDGARDIGLLELDFRQAGECELAFFGLVAESIGTGAGRFIYGRGDPACLVDTDRAFLRAYLHARPPIGGSVLHPRRLQSL